MRSVPEFSNALAMTPVNIEEIPDSGASGALRTPTILIVEDNEVVSEFLRSALQAYGYKTLLAATPDQAVEHCRREAKAIDALIADVRLGGFQGFETAQTLRQICPGMKIVYTSGYPYDHLVRAGLLPADLGSSMFLQKPFVPSELLALLKSLH